MSREVEEMVRKFGLREHPEGGFYRETYRSDGVIPAGALPAEFGQDRNFSTAIYYLLPEGQVSRFHRLKSDEMWHFYSGGPLEICRISPQGRTDLARLGPDPAAGHVFQCLIPAGDWFAAAPCPGSGFSFAGCTVSPGFEFADLAMADPMELRARFPECTALIERFSK